MKNTKAKLTIIKILQSSLSGELKSFSKFNPQFVADAIIEKTEFDRTYSEAEGKKVTETIESMKSTINIFKDSMQKELSTLGKDEKLLANFIRGKLTSYEEVLDKLNKI